MCSLFPPPYALLTHSIQWPDDYDFSGTRAINAPSNSPHSAQFVEEDGDEKEKDETASQQVVSVSDKIDDELDPVALNKAFNFAALCSVILVGPFVFHVPLLETDTEVDVRPLS